MLILAVIPRLWVCKKMTLHEGEALASWLRLQIFEISPRDEYYRVDRVRVASRMNWGVLVRAAEWIGGIEWLASWILAQLTSINNNNNTRFMIWSMQVNKKKIGGATINSRCWMGIWFVFSASVSAAAWAGQRHGSIFSLLAVTVTSQDLTLVEETVSVQAGTHEYECSFQSHSNTM